MSTDPGSGPGRGERLYGLLLNAYPARARDASREQLMEIFRYRRDRRLEIHPSLGVVFWWSMIRDVASASWRERREPLDERGRPPVRPNRGGEGMRGWFDDLRYAARRLRRSPGFTLTALVILVFGIGVNSTAFSLVNALLLQSPPFASPERVVTVLQDSDGGQPSSTSYPAYLDITRTPGVFSSVSAFYNDQGFLQQGDVLTGILLEYATSSYLDVIGLTPSRGVWFGLEHDDPNGPPSAVLTHRMWMDRLGGDPDVLGTTLRINGAPVTVIGVGPPEFNGGAGPARIDVWLSVSAMNATGGRAFSLGRREDHPFTVRARLAEGVGLEQARSAMDRLADELARTWPDLNAGRRIHVLSVLDTRVTPEADARLVPAAAFGMGIVILVLVIGTLNLANLLLVRSTARAREIAVRLALGAGRARVVRVVLSEAIVLSVLGGVGGLGVAVLTTQLLRNMRFDFVLPLSLDVRLDASVILFTAVMAVLTGLVFGLVPALRATRRDVNATLRADASSGLGSRRRVGLTGLLVSGQVAVSLLLLVVAAFFVDSLGQARGADPGFDWESTAYLTVNATPLALDDEGTLQLFDDIEARLERLPGVTGASMALMLPAAQFGTSTLLLGSGLGGVDRPTEIPWNYVPIDYFSVMAVPLLHGRTFLAEDVDGASVAVVSEAFARAFWGRADVVGESYRSEGSPDSPVEIVGVVGDATVRSMGEAPTPSIYWPLDFAYPRMHFVFALDAAVEHDEVLGVARRVVRDADQRLMIIGSGSMSEHLGDSLAQQRLAGTVLTALGGLALVLAMLGIYGVVAFAVSRRRREVGIRIALGAGGESVVGLFVRDVLAVVLIGCLAGVALAVPAGRLVSQLFTGSNPGVFSMVAVAALLLTTSVAATVVPALKATRTDPTHALRQE